MLGRSRERDPSPRTGCRKLGSNVGTRLPETCCPPLRPVPVPRLVVPLMGTSPNMSLGLYS